MIPNRRKNRAEELPREEEKPRILLTEEQERLAREVFRLTDLKMKPRHIAAKLGVPVSHVVAIKSGNRFSPAAGVKAVRCPKCYRMVYPPCLACEVRAYKKQQEHSNDR